MAVDRYSNDKLRDFWNGEQWNFDALIPTIGHELIQYTIEWAPTIFEEKDVLVWNLSALGCFLSNRHGILFIIVVVWIGHLAWFGIPRFLPNLSCMFGAY